jgi:hypothetical protein
MLPKRIFFTGVPGSRWSGLAQHIESNVPGMNISDRNDEREFAHCVAHSGMPAGHKGAYFGTGMEYAAKLEDADYLDSPWKTPGGTRIVKSHEWAFQLDRIKEMYPEDWIVLVYRPDEVSSAWWHQIGGFTIKYPNYDHYVDSIGMNHNIRLMNIEILKYAKKHDARWYHIGQKFFKEVFGVDVPWFPDFFHDVMVTAIPNSTKCGEKAT